MLRFSDSGKHPLQTVRSEKFGKGALSKILRSQLQLRWGGHSLSFRLKKKKKKKKRKTKPRTHRGCHIWALPISMSGRSFLLSVCPKYVGNVAKTLREVGTYELRAGHRYMRRSARRGPARTRFFTRAAGQISRSSWIIVCQDGVGKRSVL